MPSKDVEELYLYFPESTVYFVMTGGIRWLLASHLESGIWVEGEHIKMSLNIIS
jgi:hypothetical protein